MDKFAIVQINGKQYLAQEGGSMLVDRLQEKEGASLTLKEVLLTHSGSKTSVGAPHVKGASVKVSVTSHPRGPKGHAFRYARKKRVRRLKGYRAALTELEVTGLSL